MAQKVDVRQDQTWDDIVVTAVERAGVVTVTVERWGKSGTATIFATPSVAGHVKAGHRPSRSYRQLLGVKTDGSWIYMEVDAAGAVKVGSPSRPRLGFLGTTRRRGALLDPLNEPPGWRTEMRWGVAALLAGAMCLALAPLLPIAWIAGRMTDAADR